MFYIFALEIRFYKNFLKRSAPGDNELFIYYNFFMPSQRIQALKACLQRKKEQHVCQRERLERMKCAMQNSEKEIEQLEYVLNELQHLSDTGREPRTVSRDEVEDYFKRFCRVFDCLQHRLQQHFKYRLACELIFARYRFRSRSQTPGREYLSFATVLAYFKRERGITDG